jgi:hypothetical protein
MKRIDPLIAPNNAEFNWLEEHHQVHIARWLRAQKAKGRLSFAIGMEGVRLPISLRKKMKRQGMDAGTPDITVKLAGGKTVHFELKKWRGVTNSNQKLEHELLKKLGHTVYVIRERTPHDALAKVRELILQHEAGNA